MSSRGKKKTTMAKLNREARLRERRSEKVARKEARRDAANNPEQPELAPGEDDFAEEQLTVSEEDSSPQPAG